MQSQGLDNKISNVIGAKLPQWVLNQLGTRSNQNNQDSRNNNNILYLANKTAWVRLVSSVNIGSEDFLYFKNTVGANLKVVGLGVEESSLNPILNPASLAKEYVLYGGTSKYLQKNSYQQRAGLGKDGSYSIFGQNEIQKYGYKPMPGITSVNIETQGRLGSVRSATISFKCWDKNQLDVMDALYFKLGFTMFLEWGHTFYYPSPATSGNIQKYDPSEIKSTEFFSIDPFEKGLNKEDILSKISQNSRDSEGNYDGMLGIVTNFNFTYTQDGGYECTVRLMALGALADSIKINNPGVLPDILKEEILKLNNTLIQLNKTVDTTTTQPTGSQDLIDQFIGKDAKPKDLLQLISLDVVKEYATSGVTTKTYASLATTSPKVFESIAFDNNNNFSNIAKGDFKNIIKNINSINRTELIYTPSNFGYKILTTKTTVKTVKQDSLNFFALDDKGFYDLDYKLPNRYILGKNSTRGNVVLTDKVQYSDITLNMSYLKDRYLKNLKDKSSSGTDLLQKSILDFQNNKSVSDQIDSNGLNVLSLNLLSSTDFVSLGSNDYNRFGATYNSPSLNSVSTFDPYFFNITIDRDYRELDDRSRGSLTTKQAYSILNQVVTKDILEGGVFYNTTANGNLSFKELNVNKGIGTANNFLNPTVVKSINPNYSHYFFSVVYYIKLDNVGINLTATSTEIDPATGLEKQTKTTERKQLYAKVIISFNDSSLIQNIKAENEGVILRDPDEAKRNLQAQNQNQLIVPDNQALSQEALSTQISQALNYQSSLEIILRTIQVHALNKAINQTQKPDLEIGKKVFVNNFWLDNIENKKPFLEQIFSNGIFSSIIRELVDQKVTDTDYTTKEKMNPIQRFKIQAKYGFATNLIGNKAAISELKGRDVNYKELLRAFVVPYQINQEIIKGTSTNHPVYIPLGLLLLILNHTCTIYDTKEDFQTPLVYIDFNPELNFCLTNTKQLSTNPWKTLIPFEGTFEDYKTLFDSEIIKNNTIVPISGSTESTPLFNPETQDVLSGELPKLKFGKIENDSVYRGRMMNILLNIDYVVSLVQQYSTNDTINNVYLKPFLEQILADLNKYLGNFNAFRLSYSDAANTFQLTDDQFLPATSNEQQISPNEINTETNRTEIPLVGKASIAKSLDIKTDISSKLTNMLAISANSTISNKSSLSTNGSSYGYINTNYFDRYITNRQEPTGSTNVSRELDTMKISAAQFNQTISDFYSKINPSEATVSHATNYYIQKMSRIKNDEYPTRASSMIPVSVNFATDGISGLAMGQAFTISDELLPYTYSTKKIEGLPKDHINNVGFVMVGLTHTIENNSWNTAVRANMIFLKDKTEFISGVTRVENRVGTFGVNAANEFTGNTSYQQTNFKAENTEAKKAAENYLGRIMTDLEWSQLVAATYAETSRNQTERAWVMAVMLNRTRNSSRSITDTLTAKNQFQSVTGTSADGNKPSPNYVNGPGSQDATAIYGAAVNILSQVPKNYVFFTSNNEKAYGAGTNISFLFKLRSNPTAKIIGQTVFSTTA